jgi:hypothetical protein
MDNWFGAEEADIMYCTDSPDFVRFLLDCSATAEYPPFLDKPLTRPVNFHLEVKSTTGPCHAPFFVSQKQYRIMRDMSCNPDQTETPEALYVVLRVYSLASSEIRVTAYINPWQLQGGTQRGMLEFTADPYRVTRIA